MTTIAPISQPGYVNFGTSRTGFSSPVNLHNATRAIGVYDIDVLIQTATPAFDDILHVFQRAYHDAYTSPVELNWEMPLVKQTSQGASVQIQSEATLELLRQKGVVRSFERTSISEKAIVFDVVVPLEVWRSGAVDEVYDAALNLQERLRIVVLFEVRRERQRVGSQ